MAEEVDVIEAWIKTTLSADTTLQGLIGNPPRVYNTIAPQNAAYPYVVYAFQSGEDLMELSGYRVWLNALYVIRVHGENHSLSTLSAISARVDELLHRGSGNVGSIGQVISCVRERKVQYLERSSSTYNYFVTGGVYRILGKLGVG